MSRKQTETAHRIQIDGETKLKASATLIESPRVKNSKNNHINEMNPTKTSVSVKNKVSTEKVEVTDDQIMKILNALTKQ